MNQSSYIAGMLAIAFVVFITTRGELPAYFQILLGKGKPAYTGSSSSSSSSSGGSGGSGGISVSDISTIAELAALA